MNKRLKQFFFLLNIGVGFGQDRATLVPDYKWVDDQPLPNVSSSSGLKTDVVTIAIDTDPDNFVYTLTFGEGVIKRNPDGTVVEEEFITGLDNPLDMAIDEEGYFYIADYLAGGNSYEDNGQIKIYDPEGNYERSILTSYFRPLGIDITEENVYIAEYNDGNQGPESTASSRVRIVNKNNGNVQIINKADFQIPYRIAVDSKGKVYVSHNNNNSPTVLALDENLNPIRELEDIESPGSIIIDVFDYIHIIEYAGKISFEKFLNFQNLELIDIVDITHKIYDGIKDDNFGVKIFDPTRIFKNFHKTKLEFPVDIAFNDCNKMYIDDSDIKGIHTDNFLTHSFLPTNLNFNLEIYERTPSLDMTPPMAICVGDYEITLSGNETVTISVEDIDNGSYDLCGEIDKIIDITEFTAADEGENIVTLTVTDEFGYKSTCEVAINVKVQEENTPPEFTNCPKNIIEISSDPGECGAIIDIPVPEATDDNGEITATQMSGPENGDLVSVEEGVVDIVFEVDDGVNEPVTCTVQVRVVDKEKPVISGCSPENIEFTIQEGKTYSLDNYTQQITVTDNCDENPTIIQNPPAGTKITADQLVTLTATDDADNVAECNLTVEITEVAAPEPTFDCPAVNNLNPIFLEDNCSYEVPDYKISNPQNFDNGPFLVQTFTENENSVSVNIEVYDGKNGDLVDECSFDVDLIDNQAPVISGCPPQNIEFTIQEGKTHSLDDYTKQITVIDNCDENPRIVQNPSADTEITADQLVSLTVTDEAGNETECNFTVEITELAAPEPTFDCPVVNNLDPIYYDDNCSYEVSDYEISNPQNFGSDPFLDQTYTENENSISVTIEVYDGEDGKLVDECTFAVDLIDNQAPVISGCPPKNIEFTIQEGKTHSLKDYTGQITVTDNCDDNATIVQNPLPGKNIKLDQAVTLIAKDEAGNESQVCSFTVKITEEKTNTAPVATDNTYNIDQDDILPIPAPGILQNDSDSEGDNLTAILDSDVSNGTLIFNADGSFTYEPNSGFTGQDSFTYKANDGELDSNIATVTITVNSTTAPNTAPVAYDDVYTVDQDDILPIPAPGILQNDSDSEGDNLTAILDSDVSNGTLIFNADGSFTYEPNSGFTGQDSFTYKANDGNLNSNIATVTITVNSITAPNSAPVAQNDTYSVNQDDILPIPAPGVLQNDSDAEDDNLTATLVSDVSHGTLIFNADGSFTYEPNSGFTGQDSFTYIANDGELDSNIATVTITVNSITAPNNFQCKEKVSVSLDENGIATLTVDKLYTGDASGINFGKNEYQFSCADLGAKTIQLNYSGRIEGSCSIEVEVKDDLAPIISETTINASLDEDGFFYLDENMIDAEDNCDASHQIILEKTVFTCEDVGQNSILVAAKDASGNKTSKEVTVIVSGDPCEPSIEFNDIRISPNPSAGIFKIGTPTDIQINEVRVFDSRGRFIVQKDYSTNSRFYKLNLESLEESVYTLQIFTNNGEFVKRIIIKR